MPTLNLSKKEIDMLTKAVSERIFILEGHSNVSQIPRKSDIEIHNKLLKKVKRAGKQIAIQSGKGKGRNLQQKVCRDISEAIGIPYDQQDDECLIHSREMGQSGVDVILRGEAKKLFPFSIECKSAEQFSLNVAREQAQANQAKETDWMMVHKRKAWGSPVVILDWNVFIGMYKEFI